jgi:hypothetical protein
MSKRTLLPALSLALCLVTVPALADLSLSLRTNNKAQLSYTPGSQTNSIVLQSGATLDPSLFANGGNDLLDNTMLTSGLAGYAPVANLSFANNSGTWTASGTLALKDSVSNRVTASFTSMSLENNILFIQGTLKPLGSNPAILVGAAPGASWTFQGTSQDPDLSDFGSDSARNQLTMQPWESWTVGSLAFFKCPVTGIRDLDAFFSTGRTINNGDLNVSVLPVPVPAGNVLGLLGLVASGLMLRKFA